MAQYRPGQVKYVTNASGGAYTHGQTVIESNFVGIAIKQKAPLPTDSLATTKTIPIGENYIIQIKGVVEVPNTGSGVAAAAKGAPIYITSGNVLTTTSGGNTKFGRIQEIAGERGTPTAKCRIDLDTKDSF